MHARSKLALAGLAAALLMSLAVGSAGANRLSLSSNTFRAVYTPLRFFGEGGIEAEVRCPVTLEGSFHSTTIVKTPGVLVGAVTKASVGAKSTCTGGAATILAATLPWHVTYLGFTGILPRIGGVILGLARTAFLVEIGLGTSCLYEEQGTARADGTANVESNGAITGLTADNAIRLRLVRGTFGCPSEGGFEGTGTTTVAGSSTRITIRLI